MRTSKRKFFKLFTLLFSTLFILGCSLTSYAATATRTGSIINVTVTSNGTYQSDSEVASYIRNHATFKATFNTDSSGNVTLGKPVSTSLSGTFPDTATYSSHQLLDAGRTVAVTYNYHYVVAMAGTDAYATVVVEYYK